MNCMNAMLDTNGSRAENGNNNEDFKPPVLSSPDSIREEEVLTPAGELADIISGVRDNVFEVSEGELADGARIGVMKQYLEQLSPDQVSVILDQLKRYNSNKLESTIHGHRIVIQDTQNDEVPLRIDFNPRDTSREQESVYFFDRNGNTFKPVPAAPAYTEIMNLDDIKHYKDSFAFVKIEDVLKNLRSVSDEKKAQLLTQVKPTHPKFQIYFADFEGQSMLIMPAELSPNPSFLENLNELIEDFRSEGYVDKAA